MHGGQNGKFIRYTKRQQEKIYRLMLDHQQYTKQQISVKTGLSVATCNTLLNDMAANKVLVTGEEKEFRGVGRSSWLYEIDDEHEHYILVSFAVNQGMRNVDYYVVSATGNIIRKECTVCETIDELPPHTRDFRRELGGFTCTIKVRMV